MTAKTSSRATLAAGCKVNLSLKVTGRREDGYHTLESLFWPLTSPCDQLHVSHDFHESHGGLRFSCDDPALETPENILVKAYDVFARATAFSPSLSVFLEKSIPCGAGLGGGSSDAAALLLYLNDLVKKEGGRPLSGTELAQLGAELGADVPFFLRNEPSLVRGIGDILEPVPDAAREGLAGLHLVLACPRIHVATAWAFRTWDEKHPAGSLTNEDGQDSSPLVQGVCIQNDLCGVVFETYPELRKTLERLYEFGADAASMSGSGASIFGLFSNSNRAADAVRFFHDNGERVFHHTL